jgi:hypothetical protein
VGYSWRSLSRAALLGIVISIVICTVNYSSPLAAPSPSPTPTHSAMMKVPGPPDGHWLKDAKGSQYYIDRMPKNQAQRIDAKTVRSVWGINLDVVREDDQYYYYKVYKPTFLPPPPKPQVLSAKEKQQIADTYRVDVKSSEQLKFTPFGEGLPTSGEWREGFAIADMNGDGHPDIVYGPPRKSPGGIPEIFLGDGKGKWSRWREASFPPLAYDYGDVQVADLNGDGHLDLAFGVHLRGMMVLFGDGKGGFRDAGQGLDFATDGNTQFSSKALRIIDWNGDGMPDILALGEGPTLVGRKLGHIANGVVVYQNKGDGKWERHQPPNQPQVFGDSLVLGDFNGDGHLDFATSTGVMGQRALVNLWKPDGTWEPVTIKELRPAAYVWSVAAADFDGAGRADLAVAYSSFEGETWRSGIDVLFPRADGHWDRRTLEVSQDREGPMALATGDLNGDGHKDLAALTVNGATWVFLGDGKGGFTREKTPPPPFAGACRGSHVELADVDGDGKDELIASFADEPESQGHCPSFGGLTAWKAQAR